MPRRNDPPIPKKRRTSILRHAVVESLEQRQLLTFSTFVHPGILSTQTDFTRMVTKVGASAQPWLADWQLLQSQGYAQLGANPRPLVTVVRASTGSNYTQMYIDIERAYDTALEWKITGNTAYADQTVTFLNAWASTNTSVTGDSNASLAYGLYGFQWANIAEMMRTYTGWAAADQTQFQNYLLNVYIPGNQDLLVNHHGTDPTHYWANWDLCNIGSEMAIGIFCDRHDLYQNGLDYLYNGIGNGALDKAIYYIHAGNLGQGQEAGRDQGHAGLDFALLGQICQMAWNQGDDLFSYHNNEVLAGVEYEAKYNLGYDVPYVTYASSTGGTQTVLGSGSRGQLRPIFELFYNHYVTMEGMSAPYTTQALMQHTRPEGDNGNGDEYSWGTLLFALVPVATVQPPQDLVAYEKGTGNIQINWWGGANDNTYDVYRATSASGPFTPIASGITVFTYTDSNLTGGTYYYKVTGVNGATETAATNIASETSSNMLISELTFDESSGTTASDSVGSLTGTLNGGATFVAGKIGNAVSLDGSTGYVSLPAGAITNVSDFTIATWVYLNVAPQTWTRIFDFGDTRGDWMFLSAKSGTGTLEFATGTTYNYNKQSIDTPALPTNQWVHVAVTLSNRLATIYVNGVAVASNANMNFPPYEISGGMPNSWIGRSQYTSDPYLNGDVDDFRIYRGALPAGQLYTLATGFAAPAVPAAPATLTATAVPGNTINLTWPSVSGATSYSVYRSTTSGGPYSPIATLVTGTTYADTGSAADLTNGTPYYYIVTAANAGGEGAATPQASATALPPNASVPTSLVAKSLSAGAISLNWTAGANDASYTVRRSTTSGGPYTIVTSGLTTTTYTDTNLTVGTSYYYVVTAVNAAGESAFSNESNATPTDLFVHLKFDDGTGATAYDASGNDWNGTLVNSPTWTSTGKVDGALAFAGASTQYVSLPSGVVAGQTAFTVAAWVYLTTSTTWMRVFDFGTGTTNYMFLSVHNGSNVPRFAILANGSSSGEQGINGTTAIPVGAWTHMAVTLAPNIGSSPQAYTGTLYVNGVSVATNTAMSWTPGSLGTTTQDYIGRSEWSADPYLNGSVDDFRLYAHALTAAQINSLATTTVPSAPTGLVAAAMNPTQINLSWSPVAGATTYDVYRATTSGGPYEPATQVASNLSSTSWQDTGVTASPNGSTYYYVVSAENAGGEGAQSTEANATVLPPAPAASDFLSANVAASGSLSLSWDATDNTASYTLWRSTTQGGPYASVASAITNTTYTDTGLTNGTMYYYVVASVNATASSANSVEAFAAPTDQFVHLKFDDGIGTTAADSSGHGEPGTLTNGASWSSNGKIAGAVSLSGSSQYVALPNGVVSSLTSATLSAWVYLNSSSAWMRLFDIGTSTSNFMFLTLRNGSNVPQVSIEPTGGTSQSISGTSAFPTEAWTHVALTLTGSVGTLYVNGVPVGQNTGMTNTPSMLGTTTQSYIGRSEWSADPYLNGSIDDFRIYSRALSSTEIAALATTMAASAPTSLLVTGSGNGQISLSWNPAANATAYNVWRSTISGGPYTLVGSNLSTTSFTDTGLSNGTIVYYVVSALNAGGESANSNQVSGNPQNQPPNVGTPLATPASNTTLALAVTANDDNGEANLTYSWAATTIPNGAAIPTFSSNGTNATKNTVATLYSAGNYTFTVTVSDGTLVSTATVSVQVQQIAGTVGISPTPGTLSVGANQQFAASIDDQFGTPMTTGVITWSATAGSISSAGMYTAPSTPPVGGIATINAVSGPYTGATSLRILSHPPTVATVAAATPNNSTGTTSTLSVLGADDGGETTLIYTWSITGTPPGAVSFTPNGTNGAKSAVATFGTGGTYNVLATITDADGNSVTSAVSVKVIGLFTAATKIGTFTPNPSANVSSGTYTVTSAGSFSSASSTDNFYYYNIPITGDADLIARVASLSSTSTTARGGVMIRGSTAINAVYSGIFMTATTGIQAYARTTSGSSSAATAGTNVTAPYWLKVSRRGSTFATYNSSDGVTWTQIRSDTISTMPATAYFGLVSARNSTTSTNVTTFDHVSLVMAAAPTIASPATANSNIVTGTTTTLSVLGASYAGESNLKYTWATTGTPPAAVRFSANGTNTAKSVTATFTKAGNYSFQVTVTDVASLSITSTVTVTVDQTLTSIAVTPAPVTLASGAVQQFTATASDQFGNALTAQPSFAWSLSNGSGSISSSGQFTAPYGSGLAIVRAANGSAAATAGVTISNSAPTVASVASPSLNPVPGTTATLSVLGADDAGEANLTYTWSVVGTPPLPVAFSPNGTNAAKNTTATFNAIGTYTLMATITDGGGLTTTSTVNVTVNTIMGTGANDSIRLVRSGSNLAVYINSPSTATYTVPFSTLGAIAINTSTGADSVNVDFSGGASPVPAAGLTIIGNPAVADTLTITGTTGTDTASVDSSAVTFNSSPITYSQVGAIVVNGNGGSDVLTQSAQPGGSATLAFNGGASGGPSSSDSLIVNGGTFTFAAPGAITLMPLASLTIAAGAKVVLSTAGSHTSRYAMVVSTFSIAGSLGNWTGTLDLGGNDLIVHSGNLTNLTNQLHMGFNAGSGYWNGTGIISSAAPTIANDLTTLGAIQNLNAGGTGVAYATFDGVTGLTTSDVLVKYTYYGDADLSGAVTANDYTVIDAHNGTTSGATWGQGDFNYDGKVDGSDYSLIDNAFNMQGSNGLAYPMALIADEPAAAVVSPAFIHKDAWGASDHTGVKFSLPSGGIVNPMPPATFPRTSDGPSNSSTDEEALGIAADIARHRRRSLANALAARRRA